MSTVIWKQELEITDTQVVRMAKGAQILHVANQNETLVMWFKHDLEQSTDVRTIEIYGTGHPIKDRDELDRGLNYIGSAVFARGNFVWHVFERTNG